MGGYKKVFMICTLLSFSNAYGLDLGSTDTSAIAESQQQQIQQLQTCQDVGARIQQYCTQNPLLAHGSVAVPRQMADAAEAGERGPNIIETLKAAGTQTRSSMKANEQIDQSCALAKQQCNSLCSALEAQNAFSPPGNPQLFQMAQNYKKQCEKEEIETKKKTKMSMAELAQILQTVIAAVQALMGKEGGDLKTASFGGDGEGGPCEGDYKDILIECTGQSDPSSARASLGGATGVGGLNGEDINAGLQTASQGEPGGESKGGSKDGSPFGGFAAAGMGGGGALGGSLGAGEGAAEENGEGLNSDIHKGFMGGGGVSGGSASGGGSAGSKAAPFSRMGLSDSNGGNRSALQKKLNKMSKVDKRAPASADGTNGPFMDNWEVIKKAYQKNASSMFHQR